MAKAQIIVGPAGMRATDAGGTTHREVLPMLQDGAETSVHSLDTEGSASTGTLAAGGASRVAIEAYAISNDCEFVVRDDQAQIVYQFVMPQSVVFYRSVPAGWSYEIAVAS